MHTSPSPIRRSSARSGSPYEEAFGFSRGVRVGDVVHIAGTGPVWPDGACDPDPAAQARRCWEIAATALRKLDADLGHVVATRLSVADPAITNGWPRTRRGVRHHPARGNHGGGPGDPR